MKVIILKTTKNFGNEGEVKEVADGHARNFLIPHGVVKAATEQEITRLEEDQKRQAKKAVKDLKKTQDMAGQIDGLEIEIFEKASEAGTLYSALNEIKIAKALQEKGFDVNKKQIKVAEPIKELGEYEVSVAFEHGLETTIKLFVNESV